MFEFRMPSLGADMEAGILVAWLVKPGDVVKRGDIVCEVETQKGLVQVEIWESGELVEIVVPPGAKVPVETLLALFRTEADKAAERPVGEVPAPAMKREAPPVPAAPAAPAAIAPGRLRVSPIARRLARELGIDLSGLKGTGPEGAITRADVEQAVSAPMSPLVALPVPPPGAPIAAPPGAPPRRCLARRGPRPPLRSARPPCAGPSPPPCPGPSGRSRTTTWGSAST